MNMNKLKLALTLIVLCLSLPTMASAYSVSNQTATLVAPNTILYTMTYTFGFLNREMHMPIAANRGGDNPDFFAVTYELMDGEQTLTIGESNAIILSSDSDVTITDGKYHLPKGRNAEFTFVGLLTLEESELAALETTALQITDISLPIFNEESESVFSVPADELPEYRTPTIDPQGTPTISVYLGK